MSHVELQPGFDFQQAGKEVLAIEREGLAELDQYINQNFTLACRENIQLPGQSRGDGNGEIRPYRAENGSHICQHRHPLIFLYTQAKPHMAIWVWSRRRMWSSPSLTPVNPMR